MPIGDPYCPIHGLIRCNCGEEALKMNAFKPPYSVRRPLREVSDKELKEIWWDAFRKIEWGAGGKIECDVQTFREALAKLLNEI